MRDLKAIQRQRGLVGDKENEGIAQQKESLADKQRDVERQLANLHLEQKDVLKKLNGEY